MTRGNNLRPLSQHRQKFIKTCGVSVVLLVIITSFMNASFQFIAPTIKQAISNIVFSSGICLILGLFIIKGLKYTIFLLIPYIVFFVGLEFATRIWIVNFAERSEKALYVEQFDSPDNLGLESVYVPHHYTLYNLRPNFSTPEDTRHNRLGLRDHRDLYAEDKVLRIVFIGGSTTYTVYIKDNAQIFSSKLEQRLNEFYKDSLDDYYIQVINAGMPGATSAENLQRLIFFVSEIQPDLVVINHGLNDILPRMQGIIQSDFSNYRKSWGLPKPKEQLKSELFPPYRPIMGALLMNFVKHSVFLTYIAKRVGSSVPMYENTHDGSSEVLHINALVVRHDIPSKIESIYHNSPRYFERNTRYMIAICRMMNAQVLLVTEPFTKKAGKVRVIAMPEHNALLAKIAQEEDVLFYDFANQMSKDDEHLLDGRHVNQQGSDLKRDLLFKYFVEREIIPGLLKDIKASRRM